MALEEYGYAGKRAVVTGATSGIGAATARALMAAGAEVVACGSRRQIDLPGTRYVQFDLGDPDSITAAAETIGGPVDLLVNCAGATPMLPGETILKVNFLGQRLLTELLLPSIGEGGAIVNVSSDGGYAWRAKRPLLLEFLAVPGFADGLAWYSAHEEAAGHAYAFGKEALNVWTMQQAQTLIQRGIRINTVSPGAVQTPMLVSIEAVVPAELVSATEQPSGRRSTPEEQADVILWMGSARASYVNGADIAVDGGYWASLNLAGSLW